jgi:hypothetical protein
MHFSCHILICLFLYLYQISYILDKGWGSEVMFIPNPSRSVPVQGVGKDLTGGGMNEGEWEVN